MSFDSMKTKREISKDNTRKKLINATYKRILTDGIIRLKTIDVAKDAAIAHGTLFSHFPTKEELITKVCSDELLKTAKELRASSDKSHDISEILSNYLEILGKNEEFHTVMAKEFPFMDTAIQRNVIANETIIKNILYKEIEKVANSNKNTSIDITTSISFLFGIINHYLSRKEFIAYKGEKILELKSKTIIETFIKLIH